MVLERSVIYLKPLVTLKGRHKLHYDFSLSFNASERLEKKAIASYIKRFWQRKTVFIVIAPVKWKQSSFLKVIALKTHQTSKNITKLCMFYHNIAHLG
jgi:hypothetical protein